MGPEMPCLGVIQHRTSVTFFTLFTTLMLKKDKQ